MLECRQDTHTADASEMDAKTGVCIDTATDIFRIATK